MTTVPEKWDASWKNNLEIAKLAEEAGFDFHLPVARWHGGGHKSEYMESSLDPMAWASALLAVTKRMTIFGTVHTAMHHPVAVAKACATADHIGTGRFALNIVCGWNRPEYDMFGLQFLPDHVDKYEHGQEWWDIVERLWMTGEPFDYRGKYFQLTNVSGWPKPFGGTRPIVVNAAVSDQGRDFAARNCDFWFTVFPEIENAPAMIEDIRRRGRKYGRDVRVIAVTSVVCRPTMREALEFDEYYSNEHADWECVDYNLELLGLYGGHLPPDLLRKYRRRLAQGFGCYPIIGDPDYVAEQYRRIFEAGVAGCTVAFVNYLDEVGLFADEVIPRLERLGVRRRRRFAVA